jgi:hypothetical protein
MANKIDKILKDLNDRLILLERENKVMKVQLVQLAKIPELERRMDRMYKGWGDTKSDLAKLKIRLVQRDDLQKVLKKEKGERPRAVIQRFPGTAPYFVRGTGGISKLGAKKKYLHETVGHDLIKQPGERNRIMKWINNSTKSKRPDDYMRSPATSIGSLKKNEVFLKTFKPIRETREQNSVSWKSSPPRSSTRSRTPTSSQTSVTSRRR